MNFLNLESSQDRSARWFDHLVIFAVFGFALAVFHVSYDPHRGEGSVSDGIGFSLTYLGLAYYSGWLPSLWTMSRGKSLGSLIMPTFMVLVSLYLYLTFKAYYVQPWATVLSLIAQGIVLIYLSVRT